MLFLIVVISTVGAVIAYFTFLQANNVSIVVCSSFLTSSNMSKNFSIPDTSYCTYFCAFNFRHR